MGMNIQKSAGVKADTFILKRNNMDRRMDPNGCGYVDYIGNLYPSCRRNNEYGEDGCLYRIR